MPALPAQPYILSKPFQCGLSLAFALAPTADLAGLDRDRIADALFTFSRTVTGGYYWCPPLRGKRLDLRSLGL